MPADEPEVVKRWFAAISGTPEEAEAAVADFWDERSDYYPVPKFPEAQPCHGPAEIGRFLVRMKGAYARSSWGIREMEQVGEGRVLARVTLSAEGRDSGASLEGDHYSCFWLRGGRFLRVEDHLTLRGALEALDLQDPPNATNVPQDPPNHPNVPQDPS